MKRDNVNRISNIFFSLMACLSLLSFVSLITNKNKINNFSQNDYYLNLFLSIIYLLVSLIILYISNKKIKFYKEDYSLSRKIFNFFFLISCLSITMMITTSIAGALFFKTFSIYSFLIIIFGYIPVYTISYLVVSKDVLLSKDNEKKVNVGNLVVIFLLMNYSFNSIVIIFQMIFRISDISLLIPSLCISLIWICIILIAYKLINKKA